jgi:adenylate cyclase
MMDRQSDTRPWQADADDGAALLRWVDANGTSHERELADALTIGRHADNLLPLVGDPAISRHHARLDRVADGTWTITDLGSANGTVFNGQRLAPQLPTPLHDGDQIAIGQTRFTVSVPTPHDDLFTAPPVTTSFTSLHLPRPIVGWLELPGGDRRLLDLETRIGRSARSDIALPDDAQVSRNHASIRHRNDTYMLSDLGSANGVCVNGEPIVAPRELRDGDRITIGTTELRFVLTALSESPGDSGFVSPEEFGPLVGSATSLFDLFGEQGAVPRGDLRQVTTLFADMRGSTALSERLNNPEQTTVIVNRIFDALTTEIVRYEGWVVKFAGDNIMAIFGAPHAHEDDPERCVKAALAMLRALDRINRQLRRQLGLAIQMRFGIASGQVIYGEVGGGEFRRLDVMGPSVNLASRLEHASRVGRITVSEEVQARANHAFLFTPLPPLELKGIRAEVRAYEVVRERGAADSAPESTGPDLLIGREAELAQLRHMLDEVREGSGRLLAIVGEAGVGTSQLLATFRRMTFPPLGEMSAERAWIAVRAVSYEAAVPYTFLASVLRALLGIVEEPVERGALRDALAAALPTVEEATRAAYLTLIGGLLGVRAPGPPTTDGDPRVRRSLLTGVVRQLIRAREGVAGRDAGRPLVLVLEELHWADSASIEILDELADAVATAPILVILTYRPDWTHPWATRSFYRQITLPELTDAQSRELLRRLLPEATLGDALAGQIIAQCGNNPLLLAETVKTLRQRGLLVAQGGAWQLTTDLSAMALPATLVGLLMARLDRFPEADRATLRRAATIGRSFTYRLLAALPDTPAMLEEQLERLCDAELIVEDPQAPEPTFRFARPVMQELVYNSVLEQERRELHGQIAHALEAATPMPTDEQIEQLAYHYDRSAERPQAIRYLLRSGLRARRLAANGTAIERFTAAEGKLRGLTSRELARAGSLAAQVHTALGDTYLAQADFARAQERYEIALTCDPLDPDERAHLWRQIGRVWERRGEGRKALAAYEQGERVGALRPATRVDLALAAARARALLGADERVREAAEAALAEVSSLGENERARAEAAGHHLLGLVAANAGHTDDALAALGRSLALYRELGDAVGMQESYHELGALYWSRGQIERASEQLLGVTTLLHLQLGTVAPVSSTGAGDTPPPPSDAGDGDLVPLERYYHSGLVAARRGGDRWGAVQIGHRIGQLLFRQGETARAADYLRQATREADSLGARAIVASANIIRGTIAAATGDLTGVALLERGVLLAEALGLNPLLVEGRLRLAEARQRFGDPSAAGHDGQIAFLLAIQLGQQPLLGLTHRLLGQLAAGRGEWALAERHLQQAQEIYTTTGAQDGLARTLLDWAALYHAQARTEGRPVPPNVATLIAQALPIFAHLGMRADERSARILLAR